MKIVTAEIKVRAAPELCYRAFTNATALREWLCDVATVTPHPGGRMYLWWHGDFYSSGTFLELDRNQKVGFRWFSIIDLAPTEVTVSFSETGDGTLVRLDHAVPEEAVWAGKAEAFQSEWESSLDNLKSVLETGIDLRIANRPMLGIFPGDFTPEQAAKLGVPVLEGIRLDDTAEGMGARAAGLNKDDVIVSIGGKTITNDFGSMLAAIAGKKGGDTVEVVYYHGPEKRTTIMQLTRRSMPDVPFDTEELIRRARPKYESGLAALEKCFEGASDAAAAARPAPGEWSALDVVSHLLHGERYFQFFVSELISGHERVADDWEGNPDAQVRATSAVYPAIQSMLSAIRAAVEESLAIVAAAPPELVSRRGSFYRIGTWMLDGDNHVNTHIPQIKAALAAAVS